MGDGRYEMLDMRYMSGRARHDLIIMVSEKSDEGSIS